MAKRFAMVSLELGSLAGHFHRYEIHENGYRDETHVGSVADLLRRASGDLRAAVTALLGDWLPYGGPAGSPPPPAPRGIPAPLPQAA